MSSRRSYFFPFVVIVPLFIAYLSEKLVTCIHSDHFDKIFPFYFFLTKSSLGPRSLGLSGADGLWLRGRRELVAKQYVKRFAVPLDKVRVHILSNVIGEFIEICQSPHMNKP